MSCSSPVECPFSCRYTGPPCCPFIGVPVCEATCNTRCKMTDCPDECPDDCFYPEADYCCPRSGEAQCKS
ncbi:hypothetical protein RO3G_09824 [Rhizopus delemar RA 99-880]|uniref:Uncharacterized protein n=1 Tax=Rhizopus delemar (strain RA 99-880 / ATCC MYA-4621 / FGSC 9543 / NRRL 43880) TaxID=246409 RepID=I1C9I4_RHIO9|nr:hypothetical protein RO3G_09824 [Rhizopus delemar RA 99-880]|eukprot:EIE85114.1 hypothetical protein RO3G_09824 [Rhizopus delemar RA 99-880]